MKSSSPSQTPTCSMPMVDIRNPANWNVLLAIEDLDPRTREVIEQMQIVYSQDWRPLRQGPRWCDPY
jgi:hypothetical protein